MTGPQIIVLATPVFLLLIGIELLVGIRRGRNTYRLNDALNSIGLGILSQVTGLFSKLLTVGVYTALFTHLALWRLPTDALWVWVLALVAYDFFYYWHHRFGHTVALLWAAHAVHHQSEDYNLSTALRQTSSGWLVGWVFYLPMAIVGFPPLVFGVVALIDLLYQYWVHTQQIGRLGWFDRWFCAPSNHRVHHAVNDRYVDKNYGGILIVWDRLFGTYCEEDDAEPCVYGTRSPLRSWNPVWANLQVYAGLWKEMQLCSRWQDKLALWFKPPGWRPADVLVRLGGHRFDIGAVQRYDPPLPRRRQVAAAVLFVGLLGATSLLLWHAHQLALPALAAGAAALVAGLWAVGALCSPGRVALSPAGAST
ncbi:sterol desaturase family protein [Ideonella sp. BN130291]|uniref:sterol desaturase family protein n=1 Tax=Ideonella sp. BN130291 TaxID=3112940 RepID=UPI002E2603FE|nr:sterol desaturase family protein [Ideonella sp. BN130291]